ncbi:High mobility group protein 20A [Venturia nashicola]|nr:High mobility group protein 20A [Venturia nashicola]
MGCSGLATRASLRWALSWLPNPDIEEQQIRRRVVRAMEHLSTQSEELEEVDPVITASPRLCAVLQSLSLAEYTEALVAHGFTTWNQLLDIQEHDLEALRFKLGHRRKLQRDIAVCKNAQRLQDQLDIPQDITELATNHGSSAIRQAKRRIDKIEPFDGMNKRYVFD